MHMVMEDFRDHLLKSLFIEKKLNEEDVEKQKNMSIEEKVENNLLLVGATIKSHQDDVYELIVLDNYSKLRVGDKVTLKDENSSSKYVATIIDIFFDTITISCDKELESTTTYSIEQNSPELLQTLISCLEGIYSGVPGAAFLRLLSGEEKFELVDFLKVPVEDVPQFENIKTQLNNEQLDAVRSMLQYPPIHVLQGPPGTGKTMVLAATAIATARMNREVVIIANTHHAVNNALQKIRSLDSKVTLIKVGAELKSEELDETILKFEKFSEYYEYSYKNRKKKKTGHIIGMTIWGAITYLGLRHHAHFRPYISLVDEASLMPLSLATILGKTAPSVCLFGDSIQMPPIFRPELEKDEYSISILDYCSIKVSDVPISVLHTTYRMNEDITTVVSKNFYEPYGIKLISSDFSKNRTLQLPCFENEKFQDSITFVPSTDLDNCEDYNPAEAVDVANFVHTLLEQGMNQEDIAVITPFRRQVRALRECANDIIGDCSQLLIDTVERLQGQDVECIILSFAATDLDYIEARKGFLFNPNRLNVMISRAKSKVIIFASKELKCYINNLFIK